MMKGGEIARWQLSIVWKSTEPYLCTSILIYSSIHLISHVHCHVITYVTSL